MFFCVDNVMAGDKACSTWGNKGASVCNSKTYKGYKCKWDGNRKGAARCYKSSNLANEIKVNITSCDQIKDSSTCQSSKVNGQECIWKQGACRNNASDGSNDTIIADDQNDREEQDEYLDEYDNDKDSSTNPNINELSKCDSLLGDPNQKPNGSTPGSPAFYLNVIFSVLRYVAIAILFVLSVMDFLQATAAHDDDAIKKAADDKSIDLKIGNAHSSDVFYGNADIDDLVNNHNCVAVEMESFALFNNALNLNKEATTLLTISDNLITKEETSSEERQTKFDDMIKLALESIKYL